VARFSNAISIQSLAESVRAQMRRRDATAGARMCLGCGRPVSAREHGVRIAGALCHAECALYRRRSA
jgi:hypothetical protein